MKFLFLLFIFVLFFSSFAQDDHESTSPDDNQRTIDHYNDSRDSCEARGGYLTFNSDADDYDCILLDNDSELEEEVSQ